MSRVVVDTCAYRKKESEMRCASVHRHHGGDDGGYEAPGHADDDPEGEVALAEVLGGQREQRPQDEQDER